MVAEYWILQIEKIFNVLGCTEEQKVSLATFMFEAEVEHCWKIAKRMLRGNGDTPLLWDVFLEVFNNEYFLESVREEKAMEFLELVQGNKTVAQYEVKFIQLSCFALVNGNLKARKFEQGLRLNIKT